MSHPATQRFFKQLVALHYRMKEAGWYEPESDVITTSDTIIMCMRCRTRHAYNYENCCWQLTADIHKESLVTDVPLSNWTIVGTTCNTRKCRSRELYSAFVMPWLTVGRLMPPAEIAQAWPDNNVFVSRSSPGEETCLICLGNCLGNCGHTDDGYLPINCICCDRDSCQAAPLDFVFCAFGVWATRELCSVRDAADQISYILAALLCKEYIVVL